MKDPNRRQAPRATTVLVGELREGHGPAPRSRRCGIWQNRRRHEWPVICGGCRVAQADTLPTPMKASQSFAGHFQHSTTTVNLRALAATSAGLRLSVEGAVS